MSIHMCFYSIRFLLLFQRSEVLVTPPHNPSFALQAHLILLAPLFPIPLYVTSILHSVP